MNSGQLAHRILLAVDINAYSRRSALGQIEAQRFLVQVLDTAAREAGMDRSRWLVQHQGDGELAVLPRGIDSVAVVGVFIDRLANEINRYNRSAGVGGRLRVRLAVHLGSLAISENGLAGHAPVEVSRLLDAAPLKERLAVNPDQNLAVIVSAAVYKNIVRTGLASFSPTPSKQYESKAKASRSMPTSLWVISRGDMPPNRTGCPEGRLSQSTRRSSEPSKGGRNEAVNGSGSTR